MVLTKESHLWCILLQGSVLFIMTAPCGVILYHSTAVMVIFGVITQ
jgi:hypothetical protein